MKRAHNQDGLVAIIVSTLIMIIMSLVVLGFARLMQREQRQATDKQLSTQAFYAAESGINDVVQYMHNNPGGIADKTTCDTTTGAFTGTVDTTSNVGYSCLLINNAPGSLEYTQKSIKTDQATIVPIKAVGDVPIDHMEISWGDETLGASRNYSTTCSGATLPASGAWPNSPGIIRLDVIPTVGALTRASLIANSLNTYLYPVDSSCGSGTNTFSLASLTGNNAGKISPIACAFPIPATAKHECTATITFPANTTYFYLRMKSIYDASNLSVKIYDGAGTSLAIKGAQIEVDTTGKATDVLRRLQVRLPSRESYNIPDAALETTLSICKQWSVIPGAGGSATQSTACKAVGNAGF